MITEKQIQEHIKSFLEGLTGMKLEETVDDKGYKLKLGSINPYVVGYTKEAYPDITTEIARRHAHGYMLELVAPGLRNSELFARWVQNETALKN